MCFLIYSVLFFSLFLVSSFSKEVSYCREIQRVSERGRQTGQSECHTLTGKSAEYSHICSSRAEVTPQSLTQDELATTKRSYEDQLSMMSDHLCSMNETLTKQREEIDTLKLGGKVLKYRVCVCLRFSGKYLGFFSVNIS